MQTDRSRALASGDPDHSILRGVASDPAQIKVTVKETQQVQPKPTDPNQNIHRFRTKSFLYFP